jgi:hypothetical protein
MEIVSSSTTGRPRIRPRKVAQRSRITNGSLLPSVADGRSAWVRRAKDLIAEHLSDLGSVENTSAAERSLVRRVSVMEVELEMLEAKFAQAGHANNDDLDLYQRTTGNLRRVLETLGLRRRAKDVTPSLGDILREGMSRDD